jgi:hypothetical protein
MSTLRKDYWNSWEPRVIFPIFENAENVFDFVVQEKLNGNGLKDYLKPIYHFLKSQKLFSITVRNVLWALTNAKMKFRYAYLDRDGQLIEEWSDPSSYGYGDVFSINVNKLLEAANIKLRDGELLLIASRGRLDKFSSSPGNVTARYIQDSKISGFRTGLFTRPLNSSSKGHFGFTGLNPKIRIDDRYEASLMLINHSSDPEYDLTAEPVVYLHKSATEFLEASFGAIPPLGIREKKLTDLFPQAQAFLSSNSGIGYTVTKVKGITLASLHIMRSKQTGGLLAIEHSRPAHAAVIRYGENKGYTKKKITAPDAASAK